MSLVITHRNICGSYGTRKGDQALCQHIVMLIHCVTNEMLLMLVVEILEQFKHTN